MILKRHPKINEKRELLRRRNCELVHLFEKISLAENNTKRAKVEEITSWYQYRKHFEKRLDDILPENQRNDKRAYDLASGQIYDEMLQYLSGISRVSLVKELKELNLYTNYLV